MDNFKNFQLTTEEAMNVTGQGFAKNVLKEFDKKDRKILRASIADLRATKGYKNLTKDEKITEIKKIVVDFRNGVIAVD